ncbi:MAG TPA: hypothetical protein VFQ44_03630 [Streptosporangiaceae bacterium]|nr:hypothetical protein [Streptosporangiaceae bacterium]
MACQQQRRRDVAAGQPPPGSRRRAGRLSRQQQQTSRPARSSAAPSLPSAAPGRQQRRRDVAAGQPPPGRPPQRPAATARPGRRRQRRAFAAVRGAWPTAAQERRCRPGGKNAATLLWPAACQQRRRDVAAGQPPPGRPPQPPAATARPGRPRQRRAFAAVRGPWLTAAQERRCRPGSKNAATLLWPVACQQQRRRDVAAGQPPPGSRRRMPRSPHRADLLAMPGIIFDRLAPHGSPRGIPPGVRRWINVTDHGDIIAIPAGGIRARFAGVAADLTDAIDAFRYHRVTEYLSCRTVGGVLSAHLDP